MRIFMVMCIISWFSSASFAQDSYQNDPDSYHNQPDSYQNDPDSYHNQPDSYQNDPDSYHNQPGSYGNSGRQVVVVRETGFFFVDGHTLRFDGTYFYNERGELLQYVGNGTYTDSAGTYYYNLWKSQSVPFESFNNGTYKTDIDSDKDGVIDVFDFCARTPVGHNVWKKGEWTGCAGGQFRTSR